MPFVCLLALLVGCVLPSSAAAQGWLDAYNAREYDKAAVLLHEMVTDPEFVLTERDPLPARHLALLYAKGLGVAADPIAACALAQDAEMATQMVHSRTSPYTCAVAPFRETSSQIRMAVTSSRAFRSVQFRSAS